MPLKEEQLEELRKNLPHEVQFDINSANTMIKMIEKKIITNHNSRELSILKRQLTQFQFQLYDLLIENGIKMEVNPIRSLEQTENTTKKYAKQLSYK